MEHEIIINDGRKNFKAFFQNGFYCFGSPSKTIHKHSYTEVHIITNGSTIFDIDGKSYEFESGSVIAIPSGTFHYCKNSSEGLLHAAYQIDCKQDGVATYNVGDDMVLRFMEKIEECKSTRNYSVIASYISLFLSYFSVNERLEAKEVTDYGFLIHEFFSINYKTFHIFS